MGEARSEDEAYVLFDSGTFPKGQPVSSPVSRHDLVGQKRRRPPLERWPKETK